MNMNGKLLNPSRTPTIRNIRLRNCKRNWKLKKSKGKRIFMI